MKTYNLNLKAGMSFRKLAEVWVAMEYHSYMSIVRAAEGVPHYANYHIETENRLLAELNEMSKEMGIPDSLFGVIARDYRKYGILMRNAPISSVVHKFMHYLFNIPYSYWH